MKTIVRAAFAASLLCTVAGTAMLSTTISASAADTNKISPQVGKPLQDAIKAVQANDFPTALAAVKVAQAVDGRTPYDDYKINSILAYIAISMKDYATATTATEAAADSPVLPDEDKKQTFHNALLLASQAKDYKKAIGYGEQLHALNGLDVTTEATMAQDYYFTQDYPHAQQFAQMSIDAAKAAGQTPNETALDIVMSAQAKQNNEGGAEQTLEDLALNFNKSDSWSQLVDAALATKGAHNPDYVDLLRLKMIVPNAMRSEDYLSLGSVANQLGYATEAYHVFQKGIDAGAITAAQAGQVYGLARTGAGLDERSLGMIAAQAQSAKSGEQDIKLAEDYWGYGRYADAEVAARRAIAKGGLKDPSEGPMLLGMLLAAQGKYDDAVKTLSDVNGTPARVKTAHLWSLYAQAQEKQAQAPAATTPAQH